MFLNSLYMKKHIENDPALFIAWVGETKKSGSGGQKSKFKVIST